MKRIHITGSPRSGTTLMLEMMITGYKIDSYCREETSVLSVPSSVARGNIICTKNPNEWRIIPGLISADPNQWFVFMIRDPRDVIVSKHKFRPEQYWTNLGLWQRSWSAIRDCLSHERLVQVRYEDLVRKPGDVQRILAKRMPFLEMSTAFSQFHLQSKPSGQSLQAMSGVRPVTDASIGGWRRHKARVAGQLQQHGSITELLIELGYEKDAAWLDELEGINPDTTPGYWSESVPENRHRQGLGKLDKALLQYCRMRGLEPK